MRAGDLLYTLDEKGWHVHPIVGVTAERAFVACDVFPPLRTLALSRADLEAAGNATHWVGGRGETFFVESFRDGMDREWAPGTVSVPTNASAE